MGVRVSMLMCVHDGWPYLEEAVTSVLAQERPVDQFVIVDDASRDAGASYLQSVDDPRVVVLRSEEQRGVGESLRLGSGACDGDVIARLDADDVAEPGRIDSQIAYLAAHPDAVMVCSSATLIDENGGVVGHYAMSGSEDVLAWQLLFRNPVVHSSAMFRSEAFRGAGGYRPEAEPAEDYDLWSRLARSGHAVGSMREPSVRLRKHAGQVSVVRSEAMAAAATSIACANIEALVGEAPDRHLVRILVQPRAGTADDVGAVVELLADITKAHSARRRPSLAARREISARAIEVTREIAESSGSTARASRKAIRACLAAAGVSGLTTARGAATAFRLVAPEPLRGRRRAARGRES